MVCVCNPPPQQKCAGSKLLTALKILLLNQGTFLLHKFVDRKTQQNCASTRMCKRPPALNEHFLQTSKEGTILLLHIFVKLEKIR